VSANLALRLGKLCGNGPDLWINLQKSYDLAVLSDQMRDDIERIPTLVAL